eukprot:jgi/Tetstr1/461978/TSEL_007051.t1
MVMKMIYTDGDEEEQTESEIQALYLTTEQLSDFTRRLPQGAIDDLPAVRPLRTHRRSYANADSDADSDAESIVSGAVDGNPSDDSRGDSDGEGDAGARHDLSTGISSARGRHDDGKRPRQLYTGADTTLMETALNLCEWKLKHNIKTAAFERPSKLLKKHMLPKDGSELAETWYQMRDVKCVARGNGTTDTERAYGRHFVLEARIKFLRACLDPYFPSLPLWRPCFVMQWEAAGADDAVDMFEGTGPGCIGAAV